jgi:RNA polymerase sigma-70 factor (ECF subfamily)
MRESAGFDAFYLATVRRVTGELYAMVGDLAEAEDAVQEAYARAWQRWSQVSDCDDPTAWVRTVAYRFAVSSWRRGRNRRVAQARAAAPEAENALDPETVALAQALRQLPLGQRRAIVLYHLIGLPVAEVAAETGASVSAVKARLSRGRHALAALLGSRDDEEEVSSGGR